MVELPPAADNGTGREREHQCRKIPSDPRERERKKNWTGNVISSTVSVYDRNVRMMRHRMKTEFLNAAVLANNKCFKTALCYSKTIANNS